MQKFTKCFLRNSLLFISSKVSKAVFFFILFVLPFHITAFGALSFTSATVTQVTGATTANTNQQILQIAVVIGGTGSSMDVTQLLFTMQNINNADVTNAKVFYTPTSIFSTTTQVGSAIVSPTGTITFNFTQTLFSAGTYYFWLAFDISGSSGFCDVIDAFMPASNSITVDGIARNPITPNPVGNRKISSSFCNNNYCSPTFANGSNARYISNVTFNTINNNSPANTGQYGDYASLSTTVTQGASYALSVTNGSGISSYTYAWIDWNQNGSFTDDSGPYIICAAAGSAATVSTSVTVPCNASTGYTRMRVIYQESSVPVPCINTQVGGWSEAEDYTVNVTAGIFTSTSWKTTGTTNDWNTGSNWTGGTVPAGCQDVIIQAGSTQPSIFSISSAFICNNLTINGSASLTIPAGKTLTVLGNLIVNGTLITTGTGTIAVGGDVTIGSGGIFTNNGSFTMASLKNFTLSATGTYTHNPATNNAANATMFTNGVENFSTASTLNIYKWYDYTVPLAQNMSNDYGNLTIDIPGATSTWFQANLLANKIKGNFTLGRALIILCADYSGTNTTATTLTVGGDIILNTSVSELYGIRNYANTLAAWNGAVTINAVNITLTNGSTFAAIKNIDVILNDNTNGNISITASGTISVAGTSTFYGIYVASATLGKATGLVSISAGNVTITSGTGTIAGIYNLGAGTSATGNVTLTVTNNITVSGGTMSGNYSGTGNLTLTATNVNQSAGNVYLVESSLSGTNGNLTANIGSITYSGGNFIAYDACGDNTKTISITVTGNLSATFAVAVGQFKFAPLNTCSNGLVNNGVILNVLISGNLTLAGASGTSNFISSGSAGNETFTVSGNTIISGGTNWFNSYNPSHNVTETFTGNLTVSGGTTILSKEAGTATISVGGNTSISNGSIAVKGGIGAATVGLAGTYNQSGGTFYLHNNSTTSTNNVVAVNLAGDFAQSNGILNFDDNPAGATHTLSLMGSNYTISGGTMTHAGSAVFGQLNFAKAGIITFSRSGTHDIQQVKQTINGACTLDIANVSPNNVQVASNTAPILDLFTIAAGGILDLRDNQLYSNATATNSGITLNGTLRTTNSFGLYNALTTGAISSAGAMDFTIAPTSTVEYYGASNQTVTGLQAGKTAAQYYYGNLLISGASVKTQNLNTSIAGNLTVLAGNTYDLVTYNANRSAAGGTFSLGPNTIFKLAGGAGGRGASNFPNNFNTYTFDATSLVNYYGVVDQEVFGGALYGNLLISGASVKNLTANITGIQGDLTVMPNNTFDLSTFTANHTIAAGNTFNVQGNATLILSGGAGGKGNSNFPNNFSTYTFDPISTSIYSGAVAQDIWGGVNYGHLTLSAAGAKTAPLASDLTIKGDFSWSGGVFNHNTGRVLLNMASTNQTFANVTYYDLELSGGGRKNFLASGSDSTIILDNLKLGDNTLLKFVSNNSITLKSTAAKTARMDQIGAGATINYASGSFIVERYIPVGRKWRFLSIPTQAGQTIRQAWQEGAASASQNLLPFYGTQITADAAMGYGPAIAAGFDSISVSGPSMKAYNAGVWVGVPNTSNLISNNLGYMVFVRGDRTIKGSAAGTVPANLRTKGAIYDLAIPPPVINVPANNFASVGNPYASAINMKNINKSAGVQDFFYVWDPKLGGQRGIGDYQTFSKSGADYVITPGGGSYNGGGSIENLIRSGEAFFVKGTAGSAGTITFDETDKVSDSVNREVFFAPDMTEKLRCNLYDAYTSPAILSSGILVNFGDSYSNSVDDNDANKLSYNNTNVAILNGTDLLAIERRHTVVTDDTLQLQLSRTREQNYQWELNLANMVNEGRSAYLIDKFKQTSTPLNLNGATKVDFNIENIPGSYDTARFMIVFKQVAPGALSIKITANRIESGAVNVDWRVENEKDIRQYEVERSADGIIFSSISSNNQPSNAGATAAYIQLDANPLEADNYYRIKAIRYGAIAEYSAIVKVSALKAGISINPNPVTDKTMNLEFGNLTPGYYRLQLSNNIGQIVYSSNEQITGIYKTKTINLNKSTAAGIYNLSIIDRNGKNTVQQVVIK